MLQCFYLCKSVKIKNESYYSCWLLQTRCHLSLKPQSKTKHSPSQMSKFDFSNSQVPTHPFKPHQLPKQRTFITEKITTLKYCTKIRQKNSKNHQNVNKIQILTSASLGIPPGTKRGCIVHKFRVVQSSVQPNRSVANDSSKVGYGRRNHVTWASFSLCLTLAVTSLQSEQGS